MPGVKVKELYPEFEQGQVKEQANQDTSKDIIRIP